MIRNIIVGPEFDEVNPGIEENKVLKPDADQPLVSSGDVLDVILQIILMFPTLMDKIIPEWRDVKSWKKVWRHKILRKK